MYIIKIFNDSHRRSSLQTTAACTSCMLLLGHRMPDVKVHPLLYHVQPSTVHTCYPFLISDGSLELLLSDPDWSSSISQTVTPACRNSATPRKVTQKMSQATTALNQRCWGVFRGQVFSHPYGYICRAVPNYL